MIEEKTIVVDVKGNDVSFEEIQALLNLAHESNARKGLQYATANQSVETLIKKIGQGVCFVARTSSATKSELVGTCSLEERTLDYWYLGANPEKVLLLKLVGVHPEFRGVNVGGRLLEKCVEFARTNGYKMIVTDSAEENVAFRKLTERFGFCAVDCCKYAANNFISAVYAKWIDGGYPWNEEIRKTKYAARREEILKNREERL